MLMTRVITLVALLGAALAVTPVWAVPWDLTDEDVPTIDGGSFATNYQNDWSGGAVASHVWLTSSTPMDLYMKSWDPDAGDPYKTNYTLVAHSPSYGGANAVDYMHAQVDSDGKHQIIWTTKTPVAGAVLKYKWDWWFDDPPPPVLSKNARMTMKWYDVNAAGKVVGAASGSWNGSRWSWANIAKPNDTYAIQGTPELSSWALLMCSAGAMAMFRRRRKED